MTERLGVPAVRSSGRCNKERSMGNIKFEGSPPYALPIAQHVTASRRRRSRRDDAGGNHARQRALDCPHQNTNDVGFRPFLTCSIAARDNDGGGAPEALVIPPSNSAYTPQSKIPPDDRSLPHEPMASGHAAAAPPSSVMNARRLKSTMRPPPSGRTTASSACNGRAG